MALKDDIRDYVNRTHANAWLNVTPGSAPDEPALVSSFLSSEMYRGLRTILGQYTTPGVSTLVRGIFTHQTPKVKIRGAARSTEIADLMLVHQHFTGPKGQRAATSGNALLLQAKRTPTTSTGSLASTLEALQFQLYQKWAPFESATGRLPKAPPGYSAWDFNLPSASGPATAAAGYLAVFDQQAYSTPAATPQWSAPLVPTAPGHTAMVTAYPAGCTWSLSGAPLVGASPSGGMICPVDFGSAFVQFLAGGRGRSFVPGVPPAADHWSIFVNHMLRESARSTSYVYNSKNQGITDAPRGRSFLHFAASTALWHALEEEYDSFLSGEYDDHSLDMTNHLLSWIEHLRIDGENEPPRNLPIFTTSEEGSHIPILLVLTVGEEEQPFARV